ncbi:MAG: MFS transporter, partial [Actinomycetota bacterium]|nr:MFS transporter [Actinomycetota bacterium]
MLLADLAGALALGPGALGVALSVMTASGIAALLVGGRLADRLGRRPFLLLGAGGTGVLFLVLVPASGSGGYVALLAVLAFGGVC